jgi:hypothetical protein
MDIARARLNNTQAALRGAEGSKRGQSGKCPAIARLARRTKHGYHWRFRSPLPRDPPRLKGRMAIPVHTASTATKIRRLVTAATLLLAVAAASACGLGRSHSDEPFTVGGDGPADLPAGATWTSPNQPSSRARNLDLAEARMSLRELPEATDERRKEVFSLILEMGSGAMVEVDRALATTSDENTRIDLMRLRTLLEAEEAEEQSAAARKPSDQSSVAQQPQLPGADKAWDPKNAPELPAPGSSVPRDYGLGSYSGDENDFNATEVDRFVLARFKAAYRAYESGDTKRCVAICDALLLLCPSTRYRREVQELLRDSRLGVQATRYLAGTLRFEKRAVRFAAAKDASLEEPLTFKLYLKNMSSRDIEVDLGTGGAGQESLLTMNVELREEDATGQSLTTSGPVSLKLRGGKFRLKPDQSYAISEKLASLGTASSGAGKKQVVSVLSVAAELRPASLTVEIDEAGELPSLGTKQFRPVALSGGVAYVFPAAYELEVARGRPVSFLTDCLANAQYETAAMMWPLVQPEHLAATLDVVLAESLATAAALEFSARMVLAEKLTGEHMPRDARKWIIWWQANRYRFVASGRG